MVTPGVTPPPDWPAPAVAVLDAYLRRLAVGLPGSGRIRAGILVEVADGLIEATQRRHVRGTEPVAAARAAVDEFGDPAELARMFAGDQAGLAARRVGRALLATGPLTGVIWLVAWRQHSGLGWLDQIAALPAISPLMVLVLAVAVPAALLAASHPARSGRVVSPRRAAGVAVLACTAVVVGDAALLTALALDPHVGAWFGAVAAGASLVRLTGAATAARRCALLRSAAG